MRKSFSSFVINGKFEDKSLPVLLICNHTSWWDGIWALYLTEKIFKRKFYFMMLEEQLRKNWFFRYTGGYSVKKNSKSIIESLNYTAQLLENRENLVLLFPQGVLQSMYNHNFKFEKGIERIVKKTRSIQIIFMASLIDYFEKPKPTLYLSIAEYDGGQTTAEIEKSYNRFYTNCVNRQKEIRV